VVLKPSVSSISSTTVRVLGNDGDDTWIFAKREEEEEEEEEVRGVVLVREEEEKVVVVVVVVTLKSHVYSPWWE